MSIVANCLTNKERDEKTKIQTDKKKNILTIIQTNIQREKTKNLQCDIKIFLYEDNI